MRAKTVNYLWKSKGKHVTKKANNYGKVRTTSETNCIHFPLFYELTEKVNCYFEAQQAYSEEGHICFYITMFKAKKDIKRLINSISHILKFKNHGKKN